MKKIFFSVIFLLTGILLRADMMSDNILTRMNSILSAHNAYVIYFTIENGSDVPVKGTLAISGDKYRLSVGEVLQLNDGKYSYEINTVDKQVFIDEINDDVMGLFSGFVNTLESNKNLFEMKYEGLVGQNDVKCEKITMYPKNNVMDGINSVTLYVDNSTFLPVSLSYDYGAVLTFNVEKLVFLDHTEEGYFEFQESDYPDYDIADFR